MQRRTAVRNIAIGFGGLFALPTWASNWNINHLQSNGFLILYQQNLLAEIAETIIPQTATPGAKSLGVHLLIEKIISDCFGKEAQEKFTKGLGQIDDFAKNTTQKSFIELDVAKRLEVLKSIEKSENKDLKGALGQIKWMTIDGYQKSEYFMTNIEKFEWAPARFKGCVPMKK
jgi:Gluconate 2-dehydrogenase subunit 3